MFGVQQAARTVVASVRTKIGDWILTSVKIETKRDARAKEPLLNTASLSPAETREQKIAYAVEQAKKRLEAQVYEGSPAHRQVLAVRVYWAAFWDGITAQLPEPIEESWNLTGLLQAS